MLQACAHTTRMTVPTHCLHPYLLSQAFAVDVLAETQAALSGDAAALKELAAKSTPAIDAEQVMMCTYWDSCIGF